MAEVGFIYFVVWQKEPSPFGFVDFFLFVRNFAKGPRISLPAMRMASEIFGS